MNSKFLSHFKPLKEKKSLCKPLSFSGDGVPLNPFMPNVCNHGYWVGEEIHHATGKSLGFHYSFFYTGTGPYAVSWGKALPNVIWVKHKDADVELVTSIGTRSSDKHAIPLKFPSGEPIGYRYDFKNGGQFLLKPYKAKLDKLPFNLPISLITPDRTRPSSASDTTTPNSMSGGGGECLVHSDFESDLEGPDFDVNSDVGLGKPLIDNWQLTEEIPSSGLGIPLYADWQIDNFSDSDTSSSDDTL